MKKVNALPWILLLVFVLGCSKDSNDGPTPQTIDKSANLLATGDSANDLLSNDNFDSLHIEVAYVQGFRPTETTMDAFEIFLRSRTFKTSVDVSFLELASPNEETLILEEIADLENENRTAYNEGTTLAVYIYFADAPADDDDEGEGLVTLGAVYRNTSMIIYESTIRNLASRSNIISVSDIETATLNHEFGHLFGLVNLGTPMVNNHEDPDAESHCNVPDCLMQAELQFGGSMMNRLESMASKGLAATPVLDPECILDLQANGGR
ncbi:hypothetical protein [Spongiimicrobium sp. 3-5]|uniref:hypothetical protein n=1 Tax=Spongiimicrobium sp. 3-5 TaxID=3332596 RepID=UPI0039800A9C